ncbi:MAG: Ig-like domain-containing protein [Clostridia bacterium]|nr:Ig-like domain-containing protein [Clostridia bacterium]
MYYFGTEDQWEAIKIEGGNEYLLNATIHFNSTGENVINVTIDDFVVKYKEPYKLIPKVEMKGDVDYTVTYTSSDNDVVTIDQNGNITTKDKGTATITVTVTDEFGNEVKDTCQVEVKLNWWQWIIWILLWGWLWY